MICLLWLVCHRGRATLDSLPELVLEKAAGVVGKSSKCTTLLKFASKAGL